MTTKDKYRNDASGQGVVLKSPPEQRKQKRKTISRKKKMKKSRTTRNDYDDDNRYLVAGIEIRKKELKLKRKVAKGQKVKLHLEKISLEAKAWEDTMDWNLKRAAKIEEIKLKYPDWSDEKIQSIVGPAMETTKIEEALVESSSESESSVLESDSESEMGSISKSEEQEYQYIAEESEDEESDANIPTDANDTPCDATDTPTDANDTPRDAADTPTDADDTPRDADTAHQGVKETDEEDSDDDKLLQSISGSHSNEKGTSTVKDMCSVCK